VTRDGSTGENSEACSGLGLALPGADDGSHDYEVEEAVAGVDGVEGQGADFEDVVLGKGGGDEAEPEDRAYLDAAEEGLFAGGLDADGEDGGGDEGAEEGNAVLQGRSDVGLAHEPFHGAVNAGEPGLEEEAEPAGFEEEGCEHGDDEGGKGQGQKQIPRGNGRKKSKGKAEVDPHPSTKARRDGHAEIFVGWRDFGCGWFVYARITAINIYREATSWRFYIGKVAGSCFVSEEELERYGRKIYCGQAVSCGAAMDGGFGVDVDGGDGGGAGDADAATAGRACSREHCGCRAGSEEGCGVAGAGGDQGRDQA